MGEATAMTRPRTAIREQPPLAAIGESPGTAGKTQGSHRRVILKNNTETSISICHLMTCLPLCLPPFPSLTEYLPTFIYTGLTQQQLHLCHTLRV